MRFLVAVAVYGILRDRGRLLLMRRTGTGYRDGRLSLPAGHLDGGEDAVGTWAGEPHIAEPGKCSELLRADEQTLPADLADYVREALAAIGRGDRLALHGWGAEPGRAGS